MKLSSHVPTVLAKVGSQALQLAKGLLTGLTSSPDLSSSGSAILSFVPQLGRDWRKTLHFLQLPLLNTLVIHAEKPDKTIQVGVCNHCHRKAPSRASEFKWGRVSGKDLPVQCCPGHPLRWPLVSVNKKAALDTKHHNNSLGQYKELILFGG